MSQKNLQKNTNNSVNQQKKIWKPYVLIKEKALNRCKYLCSRISTDEWVGIPLFYAKGALEDETLEIEVVDVYPLHHAHGMNFEGDYNYDLNYAIDNGYDIENLKVGLIHSHVTAPTYFSNSDIDELKENSKFHNYYLSLITNNNNAWYGKIAVNEELEYVKEGLKTHYNSKGEVIKVNFKEEVKESNIKTYDCDIYLEIPNEDEEYTKLVDNIIANKAKPKVFVNKNKSLVPKTSSYWNQWDNWDSSYTYDIPDTTDNQITSLITEEIFSMFITGNSVHIPLHQLSNIVDYDSTTMSPAHLLEHMEKVWWGKLPDFEKEEIIESVIDYFETNQSDFAKNLKEDYEKYATEVLGC